MVGLLVKFWGGSSEEAAVRIGMAWETYSGGGSEAEDGGHESKLHFE